MNKTAIAKINYLKIGPRKMVGICKLVRGKDILVAKSILLRTPKKGARLIEKALASAVSNAKNKNMEEKRLFIKEIKADIGPTYKRSIPWSRGSPRPIKKRTTHLTIVVEEGDKKTLRAGGKKQESIETKKQESNKTINPEEIQSEIQENTVETNGRSSKKEAKPVKDKKAKGGVKVRVKKK
ncbi:MAG: 50S ribosomal protein L22 [Patescibacteria group bacterium]|nr:50S ribosomal protein L22 [Patescibacteria group bacterium]